MKNGLQISTLKGKKILESQRVATARKYSNEAALSLRSRRNGTKFAFSYETAY